MINALIKHDILPILLQFSGRKAYRDACSQLGIIPVSFVIEHITREEINIKHHGLGPSGAQAISFALMRNTTTTTLNLQDCAIGKKWKLFVMINCWLRNFRDRYVHILEYSKQRRFKPSSFEDFLSVGQVQICQNDQNRRPSS